MIEQRISALNICIVIIRMRNENKEHMNNYFQTTAELVTLLFMLKMWKM